MSKEHYKSIAEAFNSSVDKRAIYKQDNNFFSKHTPELKPFIKDLTSGEIIEFLKLLNADMATYKYLRHFADNQQVANEHARNDKEKKDHKRIINTSLKNLKDEIQNNVNAPKLNELLSEFESLFMEGLNVWSKDNIGLYGKRPTKAFIKERLECYIKDFSINVNNSQIDKLLKTINQ